MTDYIDLCFYIGYFFRLLFQNVNLSKNLQSIYMFIITIIKDSKLILNIKFKIFLNINRKNSKLLKFYTV